MAKKSSWASSLLMLLLLLLVAQQVTCTRPLPLPSAMSSTPRQLQIAGETRTEEEEVMSWLKSMKPRGKPLPSSPSKRTN
uniref:Uncharacterized protein n=1 Tax=Oryza brachyantha TaxID=4533 RepID=J3N5H4_ORYBR